MWQQTVVGRLESMLDSGLGPLRYFAVKVFGIGESDVEVKLPTLIDRKRTPKVGITVSRATITLRIAARARSDAEFQSLVSPTLTEIHEALGELIFGQGNEELEDAVMRELQRRGETLACVEIGSASWLSDWLLQAAVPTSDLTLQPSGSSSYRTSEQPEAGITHFAGGIAFPTLPQAERWLSAQPASTDETWKQLAIQARERFHADLGLAVGIYPSLATMENSNTAFEFHFALASADQVQVERLSLGGHPDVLGPRVAKTALDRVRKWLR
jgi:nicotinamide-nucleotide amidase